MPIYQFACEKCEKSQEIVRHIDDRYSNLPECCGKTMNRVFSPHMVTPEIASYRSPITGQAINSRKQKREDMKRAGCVEYEPFKRKDEDFRFRD